MTRNQRHLFAALAVVLAIYQTAGRAQSGAQSTVTISIVGSSGSQAFSPNPVTATTGDSLVWTNNNFVPHHIVLDDGSLDTGFLNPGASSAALTITTGSRSYHCTIHPSMVGTIDSPASLPVMTLAPSSVAFTTVNNGGTLQSTTAPQTLTLTQNGAGAVTWTAASDQSWATVNPPSGSGSGSIEVSINNVGGVLPASGSRSATVTVTTTGAANSPTTTVNLTISAPAPTMTLAPSTVAFTTVNNGGTLQSTTAPQTLTLTQNGAGTVTWTAGSDQSWATVTPTSGSGSGSIEVSINNAGGVLPASGSRSATVTVTTTGAQNSPATTVNLTISAPAPTMTLAPSTVAFTTVNSGGTLQSTTPPQTLTLTQNGTGTVTWTAGSDQSWATVTPTSGSGSGSIEVSINNAGGVLPESGSRSATVTVTTTGAANSPTSTVDLTVLTPVQAGLPFGAFDTPVGGNTPLSGSIAVTGWALDDVAIDRVEIWRDPVSGETTVPYLGPGPGNGKIFIARPLFISGSRPDVAAAYPGFPFANRAGWGYLLLTQGLWNQGNDTFMLHAFGFDQEGHATTLGTKTIVVNNAQAVKPFGAIDTPTYGQTVTTSFWNYGWALTPMPNTADGRSCVITNGNVLVGIDSGPPQLVNYGDLRDDIAASFPGFSNGNNAGGAFYIDTTALSSGTHQIGWLVTDSCGRQDGVGSRFFAVE